MQSHAKETACPLKRDPKGVDSNFDPVKTLV